MKNLNRAELYRNKDSRRIKSAIKYLKELQNDGDIEFAHSRADDLLCRFLTELGYDEVALEYEKIEKWYA